MKFTDFSENDEDLRNSTNLEPQDMQNRAVIHTVSAVPALGGVQNRHFHEIPHIFMKFHHFHFLQGFNGINFYYNDYKISQDLHCPPRTLRIAL